jgi:hypothetical protein
MGVCVKWRNVWRKSAGLVGIGCVSQVDIIASVVLTVRSMANSRLTGAVPRL